MIHLAYEMDIQLLILIVLFWAFLIVLHHFLVGYEVTRYLNFTREIGLTVNYYNVKFFFPNFNRKLFKRTSNRLFYYYYRTGSFVTCLTLPIAIVIIFITMKTLIKQVLNSIFLKTDTQPSDPHQDLVSLRPVFPGINLPTAHLPYFLISLAIVTFVHEYGHAIAANLLSIRVYQSGLSFYFLLPVAFVQMSSEDMEKVPVRRRIMVVAAGVWNNYILTFLCFALLIINPYLLSVFYYSNQGVYVYGVDPASSVSQENGLRSGDTLLSVNADCRIRNLDSFNECLKDLLKTKVAGYCLSIDFIEKQKYNILNDGKCCNGDEHNAMCFKQLKLTTDKLNKSPVKLLQSASRVSFNEKFCLPVRLTINTFKKRCYSTMDCLNNSDQDEINLVKDDQNLLRCIIPLSVTQTTQIIEIDRLAKSKFIYFGYPSDIGRSINITNYVPKLSIFSVWLIVAYENILKYTASFSLTLALLNLAPCYYLDGYLLISYLLELFMGNSEDNSFRPFLLHLIVGIGTFIITMTLVSALVILFQLSSVFS